MDDASLNLSSDLHPAKYQLASIENRLFDIGSPKKKSP